LARRSMLTPEVKALVGTVSDLEANLFPISREMVYDLADAIEFPHPMFLDEAYAGRSRFGRLICPPLATWKEWKQPINYFGAGQEGILEIPTSIKSYGFNGGAEWNFVRPAYVGDTMTRQYRVTDVYEKEGRSGLLAFVHREETQTNQKGQVVVKIKRVNIFRELREEAEGTVNEATMKLTLVSPPSRNEVVVGPRWKVGPQRWFEEVSVGQDVTPLVKGPVTTTHLVRWAAANGNYARIHWDLAFTMLLQKLPNVVVNGTLKNQYIGEMLMRFAGDEGWLKRYYIEHRGMDYAGDSLTAHGKVTATRDMRHYGLVELEVGLRNQRGQQSATGSATVALPKRDKRLPLEWEE